MNINIENHIPTLINLNGDDITLYCDELIESLSTNQPYNWMIRASIINATKPFATIPDRDLLFQRLIDYYLTSIANKTFNEIISQLPSPVENISCHILPAIESRGGGACYAPGKIILSVRIDDLAPQRLKRNVVHEYSHTIREALKPTQTEFGFGEAVPYSMRDYLIFEGLASVLPEILYPHPQLPPLEVSLEDELRFWHKTDLDAVGMNAYIKYMSMNAYEIGSRIVRSYLSTHKISIFDAHYKSDDEMYWNSNYPHIR